MKAESWERCDCEAMQCSVNVSGQFPGLFRCSAAALTISCIASSLDKKLGLFWDEGESTEKKITIILGITAPQ